LRNFFVSEEKKSTSVVGFVGMEIRLKNVVMVISVWEKEKEYLC
jgi:hypothetical protein